MYVLVFVFALFGAEFSSHQPSIFFQEFSNRANCEAAKALLSTYKSTVEKVAEARTQALSLGHVGPIEASVVFVLDCVQK